MTVEEEQWQASFMAAVFTPQQRSAMLSASVDYSTPQTTTWTIECGSKDGASMLMRDFSGVLLRGNTVCLVFHHDAPQQEPPALSYTLLKKPATFPLHITGLPEHFTTAQLLHLFQQRYRTCVSAFTVSNRGYGFVRFSDERERAKALEEMDRFALSGSVLRVGLSGGGGGGSAREVKQELNDQAALFPNEPAAAVVKPSKRESKAAVEEEEEEPKTKSKRKQAAEEEAVAVKRSKRKEAALEEEEEEPVKPKKKRKQQEEEEEELPRKRSTSKHEEATTPNFENLLLHAEKEVAILQGEKRILELEYRLVGLEGERDAATRLLKLTEQHLVAEQTKVRVLEFQLSLEQSKHSVVVYLWPLLDHCCRALFGETRCWEALVDLITKRQKRRLSAWGREACRELEREITAEEESQVAELLLLAFPAALSQPPSSSSSPPPSDVTSGFVCAAPLLVQRVAVGLCVWQLQLALVERNRPADATLLQFPVYYLGAGGNRFKLHKSRLRRLD